MYTVVSLGLLPRGTAAQIISRSAQQEQDEETTDTNSFSLTISTFPFCLALFDYFFLSLLKERGEEEEPHQPTRSKFQLIYALVIQSSSKSSSYSSAKFMNQQNQVAKTFIQQQFFTFQRSNQINHINCGFMNGKWKLLSDVIGTSNSKI